MFYNVCYMINMKIKNAMKLYKDADGPMNVNILGL